MCGVDAWDIATKTYQANFPGAKAVTLTLHEQSSVDSLGEIGSIDLILASPECTNHTCAKGAAPRDEGSKLTARYVLRFAAELEPRWLIVENVVHMRSWNGYNPLLAGIKGLGYHVRAEVLDATAFGVPQARKRLFLLCDRERDPHPLAIPAARDLKVRADILHPGEQWTSRPLYSDRRAASTLASAGRAIAALGHGVPFLIVYYGSDGSGGWQPLDRPIRTLTTLDRFGLVTWDEGQPMLRMLQVPELRRAMGFDGGFRLEHGSRRDKIRLLGNGVCPPVMQALVTALTKDASRSTRRVGQPPQSVKRRSRETAAA